MSDVVEVMTSSGAAKWHVSQPTGSRSGSTGRAVAQLLLGHGAGGGVEAHDLVTLAAGLAECNILVCRFEQPWRVAARKVAGPPKTLDQAWLESLDAVRQQRLPLVVGGRSAGARVACRTASSARALGVLTLAFPLHPPGKPEKSRSGELPDLPMLAVQGGRDPFGSAQDLRLHTGVDQAVLEIPGADHSLRVGRSGPVTQSEADEIMLVGVRRWLLEQAQIAQ